MKIIEERHLHMEPHARKLKDQTMTMTGAITPIIVNAVPVGFLAHKPKL